MTEPLPLGRPTEILSRVQGYWDARHRGAEPAEPASSAPPGFTITLEREAGCPGASVAREVGARLGWSVYDHELLERIAEETGRRVHLLESVDERHQGWVLEAIQGFALDQRVSESFYTRHLIETVLSLGANGRCIIVGRGATHILPGASTLRVRLVGALEDRIADVRKRLSVSREEAARWVERTHHDRTRFVKDHFRKDPANPDHYDLILNTSRWSVGECADLIVQALRRLEARQGEGGPPLPSRGA